MGEGDDLCRDDEEGFGLDLNREETWKELERRGQEAELDEYGFGPDLNGEAVPKMRKAKPLCLLRRGMPDLRRGTGGVPVSNFCLFRCERAKASREKEPE